ncbi:MAG: 2-phosphosulfolactate phosphatase [Planctomycetaceae bacterium]|nr:2-phosphosulfolactate phosphatase [Planctomycetaceae bacterium]
MARPFSVHLLPNLFEPEAVRGGIAVICDILRASTTMTTALANGAEAVIACDSVEQAEDQRRLLTRGNTVPATQSDQRVQSVSDERQLETRSEAKPLLGGERGGVKIDGFDLGNSPSDYSRETVAGRTIVFTTTNGTRALLRARAADSVLIGSFVNLSAICRRLQADQRPIYIICAGTNGEVTLEDVLFAGAVAERLRETVSNLRMSDSAEVARSVWKQHCGIASGDESSETVEVALRISQGGRNLLRLGYDSDIHLASQLDSVPVVPEWENGVLRLQTGVTSV